MHVRRPGFLKGARLNRISRLGRVVLGFHAQTEKEENTRTERLVKNRLKALAADERKGVPVHTAYQSLADHRFPGLSRAVVAQ